MASYEKMKFKEENGSIILTETYFIPANSQKVFFLDIVVDTSITHIKFNEKLSNLGLSGVLVKDDFVDNRSMLFIINPTGLNACLPKNFMLFYIFYISVIDDYEIIMPEEVPAIPEIIDNVEEQTENIQKPKRKYNKSPKFWEMIDRKKKN